jgi:hypothetical protein
MGMIISGALRLTNLRLLAGTALPVTLSWVTAADLGTWNDTPKAVVATASNGATVTYSLVTVLSGFLPSSVVFNESTAQFEGTVNQPEGYPEMTTVVRIQASTGSGIPITRDFAIAFPNYFGMT